MQGIKKSFNWEILLFILLHIFLIDFTIIGLLLLALVVISGISHEQVALILFAIFALLCMSRLMILPVLYNYLENKSKQKFLLNITAKLKSSTRTRIIMLLITILPLFLFTTASLLYEVVINNLYLFNNLYLLYKNLESFVILMIIFPIFFGAFGSYLALFLWWKIKGKLEL